MSLKKNMRPALEVSTTISAVPKIFVWHFVNLFSRGVGTAGLGSSTCHPRAVGQGPAESNGSVIQTFVWLFYIEDI